MNFRHDRALNRRIVVGTGQCDHLFLSGERIDHQALKFWRNDLVVFGEKKNCRRINSFRIRDAIEVAWNLQRDRPGQEPKVPPAVVAQDYLAQWRRIVKNKTADFAVGRNVHCYRAPNTCAKNVDPRVPRSRLQRIEGGKCGGRHSPLKCWAGTYADTRIIPYPYFYAAVV